MVLAVAFKVIILSKLGVVECSFGDGTERVTEKVFLLVVI
jgi:hypothetical protein